MAGMAGMGEGEGITRMKVHHRLGGIRMYLGISCISRSASWLPCSHGYPSDSTHGPSALRGIRDPPFIGKHTVRAFDTC